MFLAAIDAIFSDLQKAIPLENVITINTSGQQHGHVYLNHDASSIFAALNNTGVERSNLVTLLK
jgi:xylulokinase